MNVELTAITALNQDQLNALIRISDENVIISVGFGTKECPAKICNVNRKHSIMVSGYATIYKSKVSLENAIVEAYDSYIFGAIKSTVTATACVVDICGAGNILKLNSCIGSVIDSTIYSNDCILSIENCKCSDNRSRIYSTGPSTIDACCDCNIYASDTTYVRILRPYKTETSYIRATDYVTVDMRSIYDENDMPHVRQHIELDRYARIIYDDALAMRNPNNFTSEGNPYPICASFVSNMIYHGESEPERLIYSYIIGRVSDSTIPVRLRVHKRDETVMKFIQKVIHDFNLCLYRCEGTPDITSITPHIVNIINKEVDIGIMNIIYKIKERIENGTDKPNNID